MGSLDISNIKKTKFISFDGSIEIISQHQRPNRLSDLEQIPKDLTRIGRGGGYSYAAPSFGKNILTQEMTSFNRILEFDEKTRTVVVESGVTLKELLKWSFGKKLFLKIQPGHPLTIQQEFSQKSFYLMVKHQVVVLHSI